MHGNASPLRVEGDSELSRQAGTVRSAGASALFDEIAPGGLIWLHDRALGFLHVEAGLAPYDQAYFDRFADQAATDIGECLMQSRVSFVLRHWQGAIVDVGIGSGAFLEAFDAGSAAPSWGYDVNPAGYEWLRLRYKLFEIHAPTGGRFGRVWQNGGPKVAGCFWDVLEHIPDFRPYLDPFDMVFVSTPIFRDAAHARASKHFRPDEHCWYFTAPGLVALMRDLGFDVIAQHDEETEIGREDIGSFAFKRRK